MKLSIGILAHNEADAIATLLQSLSQQSLLSEAGARCEASFLGVLGSPQVEHQTKRCKRPASTTSLNKGYSIEIIVVPNGCSDNTALITRNTLETLLFENDQALWNWKVCEVKEADRKSVV